MMLSGSVHTAQNNQIACRGQMEDRWDCSQAERRLYLCVKGDMHLSGTQACHARARGLTLECASLTTGVVSREAYPRAEGQEVRGGVPELRSPTPAPPVLTLVGPDSGEGPVCRERGWGSGLFVCVWSEQLNLDSAL